MKRLSVTVSAELQRTVDEIGVGEDVDLGSESARLRAMLDVADFTVRSWALEVGYAHMATWHNDRSEAVQDTWRQRRSRSARQWAAEEAAA